MPLSVARSALSRLTGSRGPRKPAMLSYSQIPCSIVLAAALTGLARPAAAQVAPSPRPEIVTSGSGQVILPPDRAAVRIGIATRAATASAASSANGPVVVRVQDTLGTLGLRDRAVRTISFGVAPNYDYQGGRRLLDYEARTTLEVQLQEVSALGRLLDAALGAGATEIVSINFESDSARAARARALSTALANARADAEVLAGAAGGRLGRLLLATTSVLDYAGGLGMQTANYAGQAPLPGIPSVRRDVVVTVAVQARWAFVPNP